MDVEQVKNSELCLEVTLQIKFQQLIPLFLQNHYANSILIPDPCPSQNVL